MDFTKYPEAQLAFSALGTTDFEVVIQALRQAVSLLPLYGGDASALSLMKSHAEALKELLVQAIAGKHPERPGDVNDEQYRACRQFLGHFTGKSREAKRGHIYSLNYDLLLYWTLMHTRFMEPDPANPSVMRPVATEEIDHNDGFLAPENEPDAE